MKINWNWLTQHINLSPLTLLSLPPHKVSESLGTEIEGFFGKDWALSSDQVLDRNHFIQSFTQKSFPKKLSLEAKRAILEEICRKLTEAGTESALLRPWAYLKNFIVAEIKSVEQHPQGDRLKVCQVWDGCDTLTIVCGASNPRIELKTILARAGSVIPGNGMIIKNQSLRGVESEGMLCSGSELLFPEDYCGSLNLTVPEGIVEVPQEAPVGQSLEVFLDDDPVIELEITPNRGYLFSVRGVAREIASLGLGSLLPFPGVFPLSRHYNDSKGFSPYLDSPQERESCEQSRGRESMTPSFQQVYDCLKGAPSALWDQQQNLSVEAKKESWEKLDRAPSTLEKVLVAEPAWNPKIFRDLPQENLQENLFFRVETPMCPIFGACLLENVPSTAASPLWLVRCLEAVGMRSISLPVDVTNYLCHGFGRPLHAFDYDLIQGTVVVRLSHQGEMFEALDGEVYTLPEGLLVIGDDQGVIALAGIKGGKRTACHLGTRNVLLESAYFHPAIIHKGGQKTHILSGARTRFERGIDPAMVLPGLALGAKMIWELSHETLNGQGGSEKERLSKTQETKEKSYPWQLFYDPNYEGFQKPTISFPVSKIVSLGGLNITLQEAYKKSVDILQNTGYLVSFSGDSYEKTNPEAQTTVEHILQVTPPSWKGEVATPEGVLEEILRTIGYHHIPCLPLPSLSFSKETSPQEDFIASARKFLTARGYFETVHWSFTSEKLASTFAPSGFSFEKTTLINPIRQDMDVMRTSFFPSFLETAGEHLRKKVSVRPIFEIAHRYLGDQVHEQPLCLGALIFGSGPKKYWMEEETYNLYKVKQDLEKVLNLGQVFRFQSVDLDDLDLVSATECFYPLHRDRKPFKTGKVLEKDGSLGKIQQQFFPWLRPGRCGAFKQGRKILAIFGEIHPRILKGFGISDPAWGFEIFLENLPFSLINDFPKKFFALPPLQAIEKDLSFIMKKEEKIGDYIASLKKELASFKRSKNLIKEEKVKGGRASNDLGLSFDIKVLDLFEDPEKVGSDSYAITLEFLLQPYGISLTQEEIEEFMGQVIHFSRKKGGILRGKWYN
jgi:phenylalanyl-tRNA synthetase beta chain